MKLKRFLDHYIFLPKPGPIFHNRTAVVRSVLILILVSSVASWLATFGPLRIPEQRVEAEIARLARGKEQDNPNPHVRVVAISRDDFEHRFKGHLAGADLVPYFESLCRLGARVVVVDLDLSGEQIVPAKLCAAGSSTQFVWASPLEDLMNHNSESGVVTRPPLREQIALEAGPPVAKMDGLVVSFPSCVRSENGSYIPTLMYVAAQNYEPKSWTGCQPLRPPVEVNPLFPGVYIRSGKLMDLESAGQAGEIADSDYKDKVVVLEGEYSSYDLHRTEGGSQYGGMLLAQAIALRLEHPPEHHTELLTKLIELVLALCVLLQYHYLRPWPALVTTGVGLVVAFTVTAAVAALYAKLNVQELVPFIVGIWIHQLFEATQRSEEALHSNQHRGKSRAHSV
jgi:hypothetical protein